MKEGDLWEIPDHKNRKGGKKKASAFSFEAINTKKILIFRTFTKNRNDIGPIFCTLTLLDLT